MSDKPVRVAVVGVGHFGRNHARIYAGMEGVELAVVADLDEERREAMCDLYGCRGVSEPSEIEGVDAVSVAVPTSNHADVACHFLEQGIPVLVEKPIADSVEAAQRIVDTAREHDTFVGVGHVERFNPVVEAATKLGIHPLFIECHRLNPFSFRATDVGVVLDLMIHDLDVILHFVGSKVARVDAVGVGILSRNEDIANARLTFENGAVANVTASRVAVQTMRKIRVFSPDSYISLDYERREGVFDQRCARCHENEVGSSDEVIELSRVGTDAELATGNARGTGGYRASPLVRVALAAPYLHHGAVGSLESLLTRDRLAEDYADGPTGPGPVPGHFFGLSLSAPDRAALIAHLQTL